MHKNTTTPAFDPNTTPGLTTGETLAQSEERVLGEILADVDNGIGPDADAKTSAEVDALVTQDPAWGISSVAKVQAEYDKKSEG